MCAVLLFDLQGRSALPAAYLLRPPTWTAHGVQVIAGFFCTVALIVLDSSWAAPDCQAMKQEILRRTDIRNRRWPRVSLVTGLVRGMARRIKPCVPGMSSPRHPTTGWMGWLGIFLITGLIRGMARRIKRSVHPRHALAQASDKRVAWRIPNNWPGLRDGHAYP